MRYRITRVSDYCISPCKEAIYNKIDNEWYIDVNTLEELQVLVNKYGSLIIDDSKIEIYDDYRE